MTSPLLGSIASQVHAGLKGILYEITLTTHAEYRAVVHSTQPGVLALASADMPPLAGDEFGYGAQRYSVTKEKVPPAGAQYAQDVSPDADGVLVPGAQLSIARDASYTGRGFDEQRRRQFRRGDRTITTDWYALILRPSLPAGVTPLPDASRIICRDGRTRTAVAVKSDPAAATWEMWLA